MLCIALHFAAGRQNSGESSAGLCEVVVAFHPLSALPCTTRQGCKMIADPCALPSDCSMSSDGPTLLRVSCPEHNSAALSTLPSIPHSEGHGDHHTNTLHPCRRLSGAAFVLQDEGARLLSGPLQPTLPQLPLPCRMSGARPSRTSSCATLGSSPSRASPSPRLCGRSTARGCPVAASLQQLPALRRRGQRRGLALCSALPLRIMR